LLTGLQSALLSSQQLGLHQCRHRSKTADTISDKLASMLADEGERAGEGHSIDLLAIFCARKQVR
jgi:hypothetical protein